MAQLDANRDSPNQTPRIPKSPYEQPVSEGEFRRRENSGNPASGGSCANPRKIAGGSEGTCGASFGPQKTGVPMLLATEVGPGKPQIRPPGARNPQKRDPFRGGGSGIAKSPDIWRKAAIAGIPEKS